MLRREAQFHGERGNQAGHQQTVLIGHVIVLPDDIQPHSDLDLFDRAEHGAGALVQFCKRHAFMSLHGVEAAGKHRFCVRCARFRHTGRAHRTFVSALISVYQPLGRFENQRWRVFTVNQFCRGERMRQRGREATAVARETRRTCPRRNVDQAGPPNQRGFIIQERREFVDNGFGQRPKTPHSVIEATGRRRRHSLMF